jgi:DivIVA domain-containing protein
MTWFFAVLVVALIGGVAVVASGRGGSMAEVFDDRPDADVPAEGALTPSDLRRVTFGTVFRGYRMSEVDALLDRLAAQLDLQDVRRPGPSPVARPAAGPVAQPVADPVADPAPQPDEEE